MLRCRHLYIPKEHTHIAHVEFILFYNKHKTHLSVPIVTAKYIFSAFSSYIKWYKCNVATGRRRLKTRYIFISGCQTCRRCGAWFTLRCYNELTYQCIASLSYARQIGTFVGSVFIVRLVVDCFGRTECAHDDIHLFARLRFVQYMRVMTAAALNEHSSISLISTRLLHLLLHYTVYLYIHICIIGLINLKWKTHTHTHVFKYIYVYNI